MSRILSLKRPLGRGKLEDIQRTKLLLLSLKYIVRSLVHTNHKLLNYISMIHLFFQSNQRVIVHSLSGPWFRFSMRRRRMIWYHYMIIVGDEILFALSVSLYSSRLESLIVLLEYKEPNTGSFFNFNYLEINT